jgi:hypothetical protein
VRIGTVTIAPGWVKDEDYVVVAQPRCVNEVDGSPSNKDQSNAAKFARAIPQHHGYSHMEVDPSHKVVIAPGTNNRVLIMRMHDVPRFRVECADPTRENRLSGIVKEKLPEGLWRELRNLAWTPENPLIPRDSVRMPEVNPRVPRLTLRLPVIEAQSSMTPLPGPSETQSAISSSLIPWPAHQETVAELAVPEAQKETMTDVEAPEVQ